MRIYFWNLLKNKYKKNPFPAADCFATAAAGEMGQGKRPAAACTHDPPAS